MTYPKKLIEVALPLETINREAAREKSIRHGHPSTLHLWWARRPLAACRAVIFAQMVDDPGSHPELFPTEEAQRAERERLFDIIREFVRWENVNNEPLLEQARVEIRKYAPNGQPPPLLDPFAGGGSIPLEAQRLGLEAHASDLNPVAVLINKALIEIPPKFAGQPPVHPDQEKRLIAQEWKGAQGLAEDVRHYGQWMRHEAEQRIGHLYPKADGKTVIAWLWARTVVCPNPACGAQMPLVRSFALSTKKGKQAWVEPVVDRDQQPPKITFQVRTGAGKAQEPPKIGRGARFRCLACGTITEDQYVKAEGMAGRIGEQLMAIVAEGPSGRIYLPPRAEHEETAAQAQPTWGPDANLPDNPRWFSPPGFGMTTYRDLFTPRQLVALTTFSDLVGEARALVEQDARAAGLSAEQASAYADAVATYLAFAVDRSADFWCTIATWSPQPKNELVAHAFTRQALPMTWDFAEGSPFSSSGGNFEGNLSYILKAVTSTPVGQPIGQATQADATKPIDTAHEMVFSTDPPYYDNIGYADLSDFFYVWLRRSVGARYPDTFGTLQVPKTTELVATPYRFEGNRDKAQEFFETGLRQAFQRMADVAHPVYPVTVYYAFKQTESGEDDDGTGNGDSAPVSTGWETMLEGLIRSGFQITGTWPMRTERSARSVSIGTNALASSVVLVCRPKVGPAPLATRREFLNALKRELPAALRHLQQGSIAPVDLAQASIGPGMAIYSRYSRVVESDGSSMRVRTALVLINQALDEYLAEQEGEYDADTRWALAWYEQHTFDDGVFGDADNLSRAKNTSVQGMVEAGFLHARAGKVRLLKRDELRQDWDPSTDPRLTVWEVAQHLIRTLDTQGEQAAAALLAQVGGLGEIARDLAYRLYTLCERKGWASEALPYNGLVVAWPELLKLAQEARRSGPVQEALRL
jgi:putative DNA methylase